MRSLNSSFSNSSNVWSPSELRTVWQVNLLFAWHFFLGFSEHTILYSCIQEHTYHQTHMHFWRWLFLKDKTSLSVHTYQNRYM